MTLTRNTEIAVIPYKKPDPKIAVKKTRKEFVPLRDRTKQNRERCPHPGRI